MAWQDARSWFVDITGLDEQAWLARRGESIIARDGTPDLLIKNLQTGRLWPAGHFRVFAIKDLLLPEGGVDVVQVPFEVHTHSSPDAQMHVDTAHLQAHAPPQTMFQVASNFNCAEVASVHVDIASGRFVSDLALDRTQGPAACASAAVSSILRMHACFYDPETAPRHWGMDNHHQIKLLGAEEIAPYFPVWNGKLWFPHEPGPARLPIDLDPVPHVRVGVHVNALALFGRRDHQTMERIAKPPLIDQVFVAALNWHAPGPHPDDLLAYTTHLLRAAYEGTYLAAIRRRSRRLVLTLVGGGSFSNPISLVLDAIAQAHTRWAGHPESALEEVVLPIYPRGGIVQGHDLVSELKTRLSVHTRVNHREFVQP